MKRKLLFSLACSILVALPSIGFGQTAPPLGTTAGFALFTANGALTNNGASTITGDVGTKTGATSGFGDANLTGNAYAENSSTSNQAALDVQTAYNSLNSQTCGTIINAELGGQTLAPGVSCQNTSDPTTLNGTLTLSGTGIFIIKLSSALTTATNSNIVLTNGATIENVFFQVQGAVTTGTGSTFRGTILATGAITLNTTSLEGRALSTGGAITINASTVVIPTAAPLPVTLVSFTAKAQANHTVELALTTSLETNNKGFLIERSKDLQRFDKVGEVGEVATNSNTLKTYRLTDQSPYSGTSYYRLTQMDINGKSTVYRPISVVLRDDAYGVYPNPVGRGERFVLRLDEPETAILGFYSADGRLLTLQKTGVQAGNLLLKSTGNLASGVYVLKVSERGQVRQHRLIVE
ncbi:hypothetical protein GCM10028803_17130 [Larkinella knui]|uniref:DUF3494 domain-containing protein n=1 Tax=Larkinella knui TaxID=2025310 RepID=A0A3P1CU94_9BACT|nr:ice-binding family protein [Larkinella knui]RRB16829.1 DUF3494 domain-containing protein [Larkinella knui]